MFKDYTTLDILCIVLGTVILLFLGYKIFVVREKFTTIGDYFHEVMANIPAGYNDDPSLPANYVESNILGSATVHTIGPQVRKDVRENPNICSIPATNTVNPYRPPVLTFGR
jgi:hypothetical protein